MSFYVVTAPESAGGINETWAMRPTKSRSVGRIEKR